MYPAVLLMYFISSALILLASLALNKHGMCGKSDIFRAVPRNLIAAKALSCAEPLFKQLLHSGVSVCLNLVSQTVNDNAENDPGRFITLWCNKAASIILVFRVFVM